MSLQTEPCVYARMRVCIRVYMYVCIYACVFAYRQNSGVAELCPMYVKTIKTILVI